jgi:DNA-binding XRE family transcriptional regulator
MPLPIRPVLHNNYQKWNVLSGGALSATCEFTAMSEEDRRARSGEVAERLGENLRRARRRVGLSQEQVAIRASLHRTEVGLLERGGRVARVDTLIRLAGAMSIDPAELLDGIDWTPGDLQGGSFELEDRTRPPRPPR